MNTNYKLTKFLLNSKNEESQLSTMMKNEIETFDRNYDSKMYSIRMISRSCQLKDYYIIRNSEQSKYFGISSFNQVNQEEYVGKSINASTLKQVNPITGELESVKFMEEQDLKKLSFEDIKKIENYLDLRNRYYYLKRDYPRLHDGDIEPFNEFNQQLIDNKIDLNFMENIFSESMKMIYEQKYKPVTNYQSEITRLYGVQFNFLDYNIAKDVYNMSVLNDIKTYVKYGLPKVGKLYDRRIPNLMAILIQQSYIYYQMSRRLQDPILQVAMIIVEGDLPLEEGNDMELNNKINETIQYITSQ